MYTWDISHALITTYHPDEHNPSALTEYLKEKLCHQRAKRLGRSPSAQVEPNVPLERNNQQFKVEVNASGYVIGAILMQRDKKGKRHPVAYFSSTLNEAEQNYDIYTLETLCNCAST